MDAQIRQLKYGMTYETRRQNIPQGGDIKKTAHRCSKRPLTRAPLLHQVTGTEVVRVDGDGFLPNPELGAGLLTGDGIDL